MTAISCKKGLYQLYKVTQEEHNGRLVPIGEGYYKSESSLKYSDQIVRIRLGALYNEYSEGPKEIVARELTDYLLHIQALIIVPNPKISGKVFHKAVWDVIVDEEHQRMLEEHDGINMDCILLENHERETADQFLFDDFIISSNDIEMANRLLSDDNKQDQHLNEQHLPKDSEEDIPY